METLARYEFLIFLALPLIWGLRELWLMRRERRRAKRETER
ncbi:MAG: hypothetical protein NZ523_01380 [Elioraea sp.]|nr:hypothetical protein [Elioraea sp.]